MAELHRPRYHVSPTQGWMNDPNGLIQWKGIYHLFFQHNPEGPFWGTIHWGHAASKDLVHWIDLPIALEPTPGSTDEDGCFSGCVVGNNGVPTLIYTGVRGETQLPCLATGDDDLLTWRKHSGNPVIPAPPADERITMFRDHCVWNEAGVWYQIIGSGIKDKGGAALLYRSDDLLHWEYLHPLVVDGIHQTEPAWTNAQWECPDFFALGTCHVLIVSILNDSVLEHAAYFVGRYEDHHFVPERQGILDFGGSFYAPQTLHDATGRRIMWGWLREQRSTSAQRQTGWSGVMSLPRVLSLSSNGTLLMKPPPELHTLRGAHHHIANVTVHAAEPQSLDDVEGVALEVMAVMEPGDAQAFGMLLRRSPDDTEETRIIFDCERQYLAIDTRRSSMSLDVETAVRWGEVPMSSGGTLRLHVFLDHSVVEVFANDVACTTARIYPYRHDSLGVALFTEGGTARLRSLDIWEMRSMDRHHRS